MHLEDTRATISLQELLQQLSLHGLLVLGGIALCIMVVVLIRWRVVRSGPSGNSTLAAAGCRGASAHTQSRHGIRRGHRQHRMLPGSLKRLSRKHYAVFAGICLRGAESGAASVLDYVVVSRHGIFVVKTNDQPGIVVGNEQDEMWTRLRFWKRTRLPNPLRENAIQIDALARFLDLPSELFHSIVFLSRATEWKKRTPPNVLTAGLGSYIASHCEHRLSPETRTRAVRALELLAASPVAEAATEPPDATCRHGARSDNGPQRAA